MWWSFDDPALPSSARDGIQNDNNDVYVSGVTAYEIANKHRLGKWPAVAPIAADVSSLIARLNFIELPILVGHAAQAGALPGPHRDPFDRILIAQALSEDMTIVSNESAFDTYGVARLW